MLAGLPVADPRHKLQGVGYARTDLPLFDPSRATGYLQVSDDEAITAARALATTEEGVCTGFSTGANLAAACKLLAGPEAGAVSAFLVCDSGLRELSTDKFE